MTTTESVTIDDFLACAPSILSEAHAAPSLAYSRTLLERHLCAPSQLDPTAVVALDSGTPVGCAAGIPQRFRFRGSIRWGFIVTFVAVRPEFQGSGLAGHLYSKLLRAIRTVNAPVVTFAQHASVGEHVLVRSYRDADFCINPLGLYPQYGYVGGRLGADEYPTPIVRDPDSLIAAAAACPDTEMICFAPETRLLEFFLSRPNARAVADRPRGAAALAELLEVATPRGSAIVPTAVVVLVPNSDPSQLRQLLAGIQISWDRGPVSCPSIWSVSTESLRQAGCRRLPLLYAGFVAASDPTDPFLQAHGTNVEVI